MDKEKKLNKISNHDLSKLYDKDFFDYIINNGLKGAYDIAKIIIKYFNPTSVIDIGCGCGIYLKAFKDLGIKDVIGYDGSKNAIKKSLLPKKIIIHDLRKPLKLNRKFDLCISIEVAEHIEKKYSKLFIDTLTNLSEVIFFTAAPPGQGGRGHFNLQPPKFWIDIFKKKGFHYSELLTNKISKNMKSKKIVDYLYRNLMIFKKN